MNKVKVSKEDKKVFNDLNKLIIDINNNKVKKEDAVERLNKSISDLDQLKQKQSTVLRNKMVQVVYQLFNSFGFNKEFAPLFSQIKSEQTEEERVTLKIESLPERSKSDTKEPTQLKQIDLNEITKPLGIKLSRGDFISLIKDVVNNLDNKNYQTVINNNKYDVNNAEQFLLEIVAKKIRKNEARKLYKNLIEPKSIELTRAKNIRGKNKRLNILNIYSNIKSGIFNDVYFHYFNKPKITEETIAERIKLRKKRLNIIDKNKKNINNELFKHYFSYLNPTIMLERLKNASDEKNKDMVELINKKLTKLKILLRMCLKIKYLKLKKMKK